MNATPYAFVLLALVASASAQDSRVAELLPVASRLRGLPPPTALRTRTVDEATLPAPPASEDPDAAEGDALFARLEIALGLADADASPGRSEPIEHAMRSGLVAGFYDPGERTLTLVVPAEPEPKPSWLERGPLDWLGPPFTDDERSTLVHEIGHALQHARAPDLFGEEAALTTDLDLAVRALLEGDAVLLEAAYALDRAGASPSIAFEPYFAHALALTFDPERTALPEDEDLVPFAQACFDFPYFMGPGFVARQGSDGRGFDGVTAALMDPPLSTEQILHPEKYRGPRRDDPTELVLPDLADLLGPDAEAAVGDVLGEFGWSVLLEGRSSSAPTTAAGRRAARVAAAGWDGDACELYVRPGRPDALVVLTTWDSPAEAAEFAKALTARISAMRPSVGAGAPRPPARPLPGGFSPLYRVVEDDRCEGVYLSGSDVAWTRGFPSRNERSLLRRLAGDVLRTVRTKLR